MKKYLIIGASSGIGESVYNQLKHEGHQVFGTYFTHEKEGLFPLDITSDSIDFSFIPEKLDGLVYCPGSINLKPFHRIKPGDFVQDFNLQVVGAIKAIQSALPALKKSDSASIVLYSTVAVGQGFNFHSQVSASKGAIEGLVKALSAEFAPSVRVNGIAPSLTRSNLSAKLLSSEEKELANAQRHPLKRIGEPEDIANVTAFLLSKKSSWMTGQILHVDGGMSVIKG